MKKIVLALCCLVPVLANAQVRKGIQFKNLENWKQVLEAAKHEHKNIFIDAFTTWCGPCKNMEIEVYPNEQVGEYVNRNFLAIKVQFDKTDKDNVYVRKWYADAKYLMSTYHIDAFPTFLFLSPDGELLQKEIGYQDTGKFLALLKHANDPMENYGGKIKAFKTGRLADQQLFGLSLNAKELHEDSLALQIAKRYKEKVIDQLKPENVINEQLPSFIEKFPDLFSINDPTIQYMYHEPALADSMMKMRGFSRKVSDYIITKGIIEPIIKPQGKYVTSLPNWVAIEKKVSTDYDPTTAKRLVLDEKLGWYYNAKDWVNIIKYSFEQLDSKGIDTLDVYVKAGVNGLCYDVIFQHSNDPFALNKAIDYMQLILKSESKTDALIDTYANLLYKVGRKAEAIKQEELAVLIASTGKNQNLNIYRETLKKMESDQPTWEVE